MLGHLNDVARMGGGGGEGGDCFHSSSLTFEVIQFCF